MLTLLIALLYFLIFVYKYLTNILLLLKLFSILKPILLTLFFRLALIVAN